MLFGLKIVSQSMFCELVRHEFCCNSFNFQFLAQSSSAETIGCTKQISKFLSGYATDFHNQLTNSVDVFVGSLGRESL